MDQVVRLETAGWRRAYLFVLHLLIALLGLFAMSVAYRAGVTIESIKSALF